LTYLQDDFIADGKDPAAVAGYRGGYLPLERRHIEHGLRDGVVRGVVATNALELGIDIGRLSAAILTGYPGSVASTWQQAGRAGRQTEKSAVIMIAGSSPLDQYICQHPRYLFEGSPEHALCNPDNLRIMIRHLTCAAFELPFKAGEDYGRFGPVDDILDVLVEAGQMHQTQDQYHWLGDGLPAHDFSLRTSGDDTVVIQDDSGHRPEVIGEVEMESAPQLVHEGADLGDPRPGRVQTVEVSFPLQCVQAGEEDPAEFEVGQHIIWLFAEAALGELDRSLRVAAVALGAGGQQPRLGDTGA
jgi:DEAD/DEAH box helicase domain-containing protein